MVKKLKIVIIRSQFPETISGLQFNDYIVTGNLNSSRYSLDPFERMSYCKDNLQLHIM